MKIRLGILTSRKSGLSGATGELVRFYLERAARYAPCDVLALPSEAALLSALERDASRVRPTLWLAESRGELCTSQEIASDLVRCFDGGAQQLVLAIGPADGWGPQALEAADQTFSFGRITLPHELAAVVAAEQIYRALTIRAGHPYHSGH